MTTQSNMMVRPLVGRAFKSPMNPTTREASKIEERGCSVQLAQVQILPLPPWLCELKPVSVLIYEMKERILLLEVTRKHD